MRDDSIAKRAGKRCLFSLAAIAVMQEVLLTPFNRSTLALEQETSSRDRADSPCASFDTALTVLRDSSANANEKLQAFYCGLSLEEGDMIRFFREVIQLPDASIAALAAQQLIARDVSDAFGLVARRAEDWDAYNQALVIGFALTYDRRDPFRELARVIVRNARSRATPADRAPGERPLDELAVALLSDALTPEDAELLKRLLHRNKFNRAAWLGLAHASAPIDEPLRALAQVVWQDREVPASIRAAAAAASAVTDTDGLNALVELAQSFLDRFGRKKYEQGLISLMRDAPGEIAEFEEGLRTLGAVGFCQHAESRTLIAGAMQSENSIIKLTAGIIAARRWPEAILESTEKAGESELQVNWLSCVAYFHPQKILEIPVARRSEVDAKLGTIREVGLVSAPGLQGWPVKAALGW